MVKSKKQEKVFFLIYDINELITKWLIIPQKECIISTFFSSYHQNTKYIITFAAEKELIAKTIKQTILLPNIEIAYQYLIKNIIVK